MFKPYCSVLENAKSLSYRIARIVKSNYIFRDSLKACITAIGLSNEEHFLYSK